MVDSRSDFFTRIRARISSTSVPVPSSGSIIRVLTSPQNCSALLFSIFLGVHLVSPIAATIGGISLADKTLLIGRAYYLPSETITIYLPLAIHLTSSTLKRFILLWKTRKLPPITPHVITGWLLPLFLIPHILTHRLIPSSSSPPISNLSPGELGFDFVGWGIDRWPLWSYVSYLPLVGLGVWHSGVGMMKIVSWIKRIRGGSTSTLPTTQAGQLDGVEEVVVQVDKEAQTLISDKAEETPRRIVSKKRKIGLRSVLVVFLGFIAVGLARVARESRGTSRFMSTRYEAVYARLWR